RVRSLAGELGRARVDPERLVLEPVLAEHQRRTAEGVGLGHVGAGIEIRAVDVADDPRPGQDQVLVAALQLRPAEVRCLEILPLDERAHRAVEDEDPRGQRLAKLLDPLLGGGAHRFSPEMRNTRKGELACRGWTSRVKRSKPARASVRSRTSGAKPRCRWPSRSRTQLSSCGSSSSTTTFPPAARMRAASPSTADASSTWCRL